MVEATVTQEASVPYDPKYGLSEAQFNAQIAERNRLSDPNLITTNNPINQAQMPTSNVFTDALSSGGGGGGGVGTSTDGFTFEDTGPVEDAKSEADRIIDEAYNSGISALDQFEATLGPGFERERSALLREQELKTGRAREKESLDLADLSEQERREESRTESAIAKSRREASELMQGIASRFGGGTGIGGFASELMGRQVLENISGNRESLQIAKGQIIAAGNRIKLATQSFIDDLELQTQNLINEAQAGLAQARREIASRRDLLAQQKADRQLDALYRFQDTINSINQRNTELKNAILFKAQSATRGLAQLTANKVPEISAKLNEFGDFEFAGSGLTPDNLDTFTGVVSGLQGTTAPGTSQAGAGTTFNQTGDEELSALNQFTGMVGGGGGGTF